MEAKMIGDLAHQVVIMEEEIEELRRENEELKARLETTEKSLKENRKNR